MEWNYVMFILFTMAVCGGCVLFGYRMGRKSLKEGEVWKDGHDQGYKNGYRAAVNASRPYS